MAIQLDSRLFVRRTDAEIEQLIGVLLRRNDLLGDLGGRIPSTADITQRMLMDTRWQILQTTGPEITSPQFSALTFLVFKMVATPVLAAGAPVPNRFSETHKSQINCQIQVKDIDDIWLPWVEFKQEHWLADDGDITPRVQEIVVSTRTQAEFLPGGLDGRFKIANVAKPTDTLRAVTTVFWTNSRADRVLVTSNIDNA
jgi:hypothetical protein